MDAMHILYIDDNQLDAVLLEKCFKMKSAAIQFTHFLDGASFLEFLNRRSNFANTTPISINPLIVLDINMPCLSGFEILSIIKNHQNNELRQLPVIMFSSSSRSEDVEKCKQLGAEDYIVKPFLHKDLLEICSDIISKMEKII